MTFGDSGLGGAEAVRAVLADSDAFSRRRVRDALQRADITVVAEATTGAEAIELATFYRPDIVLMDVDMWDPSGVEATRTIRGRLPAVAVVLLADAGDSALGLRALRAGAAGFIPRSTEADVLVRVVRGVLEGEAGISRRLAMELLEDYRQAPRDGSGLRPVRSPLTDREWEVLDLIAAGAGTEEVADTLVLSSETVRSHLKNVYRKLGVRSREEAAAAARRLRELVL